MNTNLLLLAMMTGPLAAVPISGPGPTCQLLAPEMEVSAGQEIVVPVSLKNAPGLAAMELDIAYDADVVEALGAELGPLGNGMLMEVELAKPGFVILSLATSQSGPQGDGELLAVRFRVKGSAGQTSPIAFRNVRAWRSDNELEVPPESIDGKMIIVSAVDWRWGALVGGGLVCLLVVAWIARRSRRTTSRTPPQSASVPRKCSKCGANVPPDSKFCGSCGWPAPQKLNHVV